jgi:hypothetical protein
MNRSILAFPIFLGYRKHQARYPHLPFKGFRIFDRASGT